MKHIGLIVCIVTTSLAAIDNPVFYRSTLFSGEPRLACRYLHTLTANVLGGTAHCARNCSNTKVPLLDIYGVQNMQHLASGVPGLSSTNPLDATLIDLQNVSQDPNFGKLSWSGQLSIFEINFDVLCNFENGFFLRWYSPIRRASLSTVRYTDVSSPQAKLIPEWQSFLGSLNALLKRYDLSTKAYDETALESLSFFAGYTKNYQETTHLDYIDFSILAGILVPTGNYRNPCRVFEIPLGYNYYAARLWGDLSFGAYDWLTIGTHADALFFFPSWSVQNIQTDPRQQGFIKLARTNARRSLRPLVTANAYIKADHLIHGLSVLFAYTYGQKGRDCLTLCNSAFNARIANSDRQLLGWNMHTFTTSVEYDFAVHGRFGPRIALSYNYVITGRSIIATNTAQGTCALEYIWEY